MICYITTRFIANYQKGVTINSNIQVLEAMKIGQNKFVEIVQVLDNYYVLAVSKDNVTLLGSLSEEEARRIKLKKSRGSKQFNETLNDVMDKFKDRISKK